MSLRRPAQAHRDKGLTQRDLARLELWIHEGLSGIWELGELSDLSRMDLSRHQLLIFSWTMDTGADPAALAYGLTFAGDTFRSVLTDIPYLSGGYMTGVLGTGPFPSPRRAPYCSVSPWTPAWAAGAPPAIQEMWMLSPRPWGKPFCCCAFSVHNKRPPALPSAAARQKVPAGLFDGLHKFHHRSSTWVPV